MKNVISSLFLFLSSSLVAQEINFDVENITPDSRYIVNEDGTVTDIITGLMWGQCSEGQTWELDTGVVECSGIAANYTWDAALTLANNMIFAGYSDWRLPNIKELASLVAEDRYYPAINIAVFPSTPLSEFWSGTPGIHYEYSSWYLNFNRGSVGGLGRRLQMHVRLVRNIP